MPAEVCEAADFRQVMPLGRVPTQCQSRCMTALVPSAGASTTDLLRWVFDRLNEQDTASLRWFWTPATVEYFPDATCRGSDEVAAWFAEKFAAIKGFHLEVIAIAESGDGALVHWRMTGRHVGTLLGLAGTGRAIELDGSDHFILHDRTVVTNTVVFDQMAFARQVGLLPPDRSPADRALKTAFNARTRLVVAARRLRQRQSTPQAER